MPSLRAEGVTKRFFENSVLGTSGGQLLVLDQLNLEFKAGQMCSLYGPNGCGKSTLLDILAGNQVPDAGTVHYSKDDSQVGFVWQDFRSAIFPWLSVAQNIALTETIDGQSKVLIDKAAVASLTALDIGLPLDKKARDLSGGQQQMVCIARLVASNASLIFLDEPFSAIDERNKYIISRRLRQWIIENGKTALMVTHNLDESILLGDRLLILSNKPMLPMRDIEINLENRESPDTLNNREFASIRTEALWAVSQWIK